MDVVNTFIDSGCHRNIHRLWISSIGSSSRCELRCCFWYIHWRPSPKICVAKDRGYDLIFLLISEFQWWQMEINQLPIQTRSLLVKMNHSIIKPKQQKRENLYTSSHSHHSALYETYLSHFLSVISWIHFFFNL